jgi:hypothetical protein
LRVAQIRIRDRNSGRNCVKLEVLNVALEAIELLRPIVVRIKKHDRNLARQITDAANSNILNTSEGAPLTPALQNAN